MEEPSVLDYVVEKLTFWKKGQLSILRKISRNLVSYAL